MTRSGYRLWFPEFRGSYVQGNQFDLGNTRLTRNTDRALGSSGGPMWLRVGSRNLKGQNMSSCQVLPKGRHTSGEFEYIGDDGCEYSPTCLRCPLPLCKYDDPVGALRWPTGEMLLSETGKSVQLLLFSRPKKGPSRSACFGVAKKYGESTAN